VAFKLNINGRSVTVDAPGEVPLLRAGWAQDLRT
jgi:hypothetical protein